MLYYADVNRISFNSLGNHQQGADPWFSFFFWWGRVKNKMMFAHAHNERVARSILRRISAETPLRASSAQRGRKGVFS